MGKRYEVTEPIIINVFDAPVEDVGKATAPGDDVQSAPGVLPGSPTGSSSRAASLSLMKAVTSSDLEKKLLMLKIAVFENDGESSKKMKNIRKDWVKEIDDVSELCELSDKDRKKLAEMLFDDFVSFVFSRDNLHKNSDDLRALLDKLSRIEAAREAFFGINGLPGGFIEKVFSASSPVFGLMSEIIELYHDDSFRNSMRRYVDDAFSSEMASPEMGADDDVSDAPAGSLLSRQDIT